MRVSPLESSDYTRSARQTRAEIRGESQLSPLENHDYTDTQKYGVFVAQTRCCPGAAARAPRGAITAILRLRAASGVPGPTLARRDAAGRALRPAKVRVK